MIPALILAGLALGGALIAKGRRGSPERELRPIPIPVETADQTKDRPHAQDR